MHTTSPATVDEPIDRDSLDALVAHHGLGVADVQATLEIARARPTREELGRFVVVLLRLSGVLSMVAGIVFFIAANWAGLGKAERFLLVEAVLVVSCGFALWRTPPNSIGRHGALVAFATTGVLLALFGQTYQTGANSYELFLAWSALGLPFVMAAQWSVAWGAWLVVLNVALSLFVGSRAQDGWLWMVVAGANLEHSALLLLPMMINYSLWGIREYLEQTRWVMSVPSWLGRLALGFGVAYATWAGMRAILGTETSARAVLLFVMVAFAGIVAYTIKKREDVFPVAAVAASLIVLTTCALSDALQKHDELLFLTLTVWLIASSAVSGRLIMKLQRAWTDTPP